ncbi:hypothetical protein [Humibacillus sp. DSM 29435]|uniref:hypothetical protein n=1 Tax=Humibacillus sp. DSM 29435 TaxID=1869167 RepID=UPI001586A524|nr:hypothetical protein [Humibacillus sp. DSM 29435]
MQIGLLTDHSGFVLMLEEFEGNKTRDAHVDPLLRWFTTAPGPLDVTIFANGGIPRSRT